MSRFANPDAKERISLGPCECLGTPHDEDWIELRSEIGAEDVAALQAESAVDGLARLIVAWNLLDFDGSPAPTDREHVARLYSDNLEPVSAWIADHLRVVTALPNRSAARSPITSVASGSRRTQRPKRVA